MKHGQGEKGTLSTEAGVQDLAEPLEQTPWGLAGRLKPPIAIEGTPMRWDLPACELGSSEPAWN